MRISSLFVQGLKNPTGFMKFIVMLPKFIRLFLRLLFDGRVPLFSRLLFVFSLIYFLSPIDLIPELLLPLIGYADDLMIFIFTAKKMLKDAPPEVVAEHISQIEGRQVDISEFQR